MRERLGIPLGIFLVSRGGLMLLAYLSLVLNPTHGTPYQQIDNLFLDGWVRWDSAWYISIAELGYTNLPDQHTLTDTRFFPLYPGLMRLLDVPCGGSLTAGLLLSNLAFLGALIGLHELVRERFGPEVAVRSLVLLGVFPYSFFFSAVYSEALFLACVVWAFLCGQRQRWLLAGLFGSLAAATRVPGCLLAPALLLLYLEQIEFDRRRIRWDILALGLVPVLPGLYLVYLGVAFGDPLAFTASHVQAYRGPEYLLEILGSLRQPGPFLDGTYAPSWQLLHLLSFPVALAACVVAFLKTSRPWGLWGVLHLLCALPAWLSMGRYVAVVFPVFVVGAQTLPAGWFRQVAFASTVLLGMLTMMFVRWHHAAV